MERGVEMVIGLLGALSLEAPMCRWIPHTRPNVYP